jgi:glucose/arabinose dehydrogenase
VLIGSALGLLAAGCTSFPEQPDPAGWSPAQQLTPQAGPVPELPGELPKGPGQGQQPGQQPTPVPPPEGCKDFSPNVVGTCLEPVSGVALTDVNQTTGAVTALATERVTGRLLKVTKDVDPVEVAKFEVDASADGGLSGLTLSPTYVEDQLVYVYVTTATDNRVMRLAPGDVPKPVLTGIPKGPTGNRGALAYDRTGALLVATGAADRRHRPAGAGQPDGRVAGAGEWAEVARWAVRFG